MTYKAKVAVCSEIVTKHSTQSEHRVVFLNVTTGDCKETAGLCVVMLVGEWFFGAKSRCLKMDWACGAYG